MSKGIEALNAMIEDEYMAAPAYGALAMKLIPDMKSEEGARVLAVLLEEHAKDEQKHHAALLKLKSIIY